MSPPRRKITKSETCETAPLSLWPGASSMKNSYDGLQPFLCTCRISVSRRSLVYGRDFTFMFFEQIGRTVHSLPLGLVELMKAYQNDWKERAGRQNEISLYSQRCELGVTGFSIQFFGVGSRLRYFRNILQLWKASHQQVGKVRRLAK